jgi:tyrosyl-tRNA synthetase
MFKDRAQARSEALITLLGRGYVYQTTNSSALDDAFASGVVPAYIGFDATADSLHVGHLLPIMTLRRLQQTGHKPIVLMGGGTTRIGDPSFRSEARPMLSDSEIASNITSIRRVFGRFLVFGDGPTDAIMLNNAEWLNGLRYIDMLREVGRHFSVNRMLTFDSVKSRLENQDNLSLLEFNYMILQAYDFLELARREGCRLQMGGADQWGNIVNGVDLVRRIEGTEVFGLTSPLLTTASGTKMGKTASGAVRLNEERLAPYDYWQFWRNTEDADVGRFLSLFTDLPLDEVEGLAEQTGADLNAAKERLATEATSLAHGREAAEKAAATARQAFGHSAGAEGLPVVDISSAEVERGFPLVDLVVRAGLAASKGEARRAIEGRGVRLDSEIVEDVGHALRARSLPVRVSLGRKRHVAIRVTV